MYCTNDIFAYNFSLSANTIDKIKCISQLPEYKSRKYPPIVFVYYSQLRPPLIPDKGALLETSNSI